MGVDNFSDYYSKKLKLHRLERLQKYKNFLFKEIDISIKKKLETLDDKFDLVINLAAQAGVRTKIELHENYIYSNIVGQFNILNFCKDRSCKLFYASSSSLYKNNENRKSSEVDQIEPLNSLYALSKFSGELLSNFYVKKYDVSTVGLRFFTVYGSWGRPDMAYWVFTKKNLQNQEIPIFGDGNQMRDFTHISTVSNAIERLIQNIDKLNGSKIFNIGNEQPRRVLDLLKIIETFTGKKLKLNFYDRHTEDVQITSSNTESIESIIGPLEHISLENGMQEFIEWFKKYHESFYN